MMYNDIDFIINSASHFNYKLAVELSNEYSNSIVFL